jgi:hypothetical protein
MLKQKTKGVHASKSRLTLNRTDTENNEPVLVIRQTQNSQIRITPSVKVHKEDPKPLLPSLTSSKMTIPHP